MLRSSLKSPCVAAVCLGATGIRVDIVINRTDKTLSASKTVLSLVITAPLIKSN